MYRPVDRAILAARGLLPANGPIVDFAKPSEIRDWLDKAMALGAEATTFGIVDVIDRHCELAAIGALLQKQENVENTTLQTIIQIREQIVQTPTVPIDVEALAEANGLSRSTFLQQWNTLVGEPPKRHIDRMRMALACSMLTGTYQSINAIATELGFGDPLHFSRRFRQLIGQPPSEYRQTHRMDRNSK